MTNNKVIQKANKFIEENKINNHPVNIVKLCKQNGIEVFEEYLPEKVSGFIVIDDKNFQNYNTGKLIVVNLLDGAQRRRFTIAHELAHYVLHRKSTDGLYAHRDAGQNGGIEREANEFASAILMPENLIQDSLEELNEMAMSKFIPPIIKIEHIAREFAVSRAAAEVRLNKLGLL